WDGTLTFTDVATGRERATLKDDRHWVYSLVFAPDGQTLATGGWGGTGEMGRGGPGEKGFGPSSAAGFLISPRSGAGMASTGLVPSHALTSLLLIPILQQILMALAVPDEARQRPTHALSFPRSARGYEKFLVFPVKEWSRRAVILLRHLPSPLQ